MLYRRICNSFIILLTVNQVPSWHIFQTSNFASTFIELVNAGSIHTLRIRYCASTSKQQKAVPWNTQQLQAVAFSHSALDSKSSVYFPFSIFPGPRVHKHHSGRGCAQSWARRLDPLSSAAWPTWALLLQLFADSHLLPCTSQHRGNKTLTHLSLLFNTAIFILA